MHVLHHKYNSLTFIVSKNLQTPNSISIPNFLQGQIPTLPSSLKWCLLSENNLVGEIPSSICNLSSLIILSLYKNSFRGRIPECIGDWSSFLNNYVHGKIPKGFAQGCTLQNFQVNNNQLEGSLPRSLANCKDLKFIDVENNYLNDTFPDWLGNLDHLQVLILRSNRFYGQVVNSNVIVSFPRLHVIDLSHNNLSGYLPIKFFENLHAIRKGNEKKGKPEYMMNSPVNWTRYSYVRGLSFMAKGSEMEFESLLTSWMVIDFSNNKFLGEIPKTLGELHSLIVLNLSHNSLTGPIPSSLGDLLELESLDLSSNKLQGRIPTELTNLGFLAVLNLSQNNLTGPIPQGKQFNTFNNDSYIGNFGLCGLPLSNRCDNDEKTPGKFDGDDDEELDWRYSILMGYGCGLVLGVSLGYIVLITGKPWWLVKIIERVQQRFTKR
ncbi:receptor-like protein 9DC3 [Gossypium arboreum]|uniref:receptor-like protein 9DC3 n=1 Tax=Gossypium arboreum TaxID=29729 RepID=UPI0022F1B9A9|nr:receptor-like protein 9DC3 [Gossypium arboreum]